MIEPSGASGASGASPPSNEVPSVPKTKFSLYQGYDGPGSTKQIECAKCGSNKFYVGSGSYFTVVKCCKCNHEECIHDG